MRAKDNFGAEHLIMEQLLHHRVSAGGWEINRVRSTPSDGVHTPAGETMNSSWSYTHSGMCVTETQNERAECAYSEFKLEEQRCVWKLHGGGA